MRCKWYYLCFLIWLLLCWLFLLISFFRVYQLCRLIAIFHRNSFSLELRLTFFRVSILTILIGFFLTCCCLRRSWRGRGRISGILSFMGGIISFGTGCFWIRSWGVCRSRCLWHRLCRWLRRLYMTSTIFKHTKIYYYYHCINFTYKS